MASRTQSPHITSAIWSFVVLVAVKTAYSLFRIVTTSAPDFAYYYEAATRGADYVRDTVHLLPPASVLVYLPLGWFPYGFIQTIWVLGSFAVLAYVTALLLTRAGYRGVLPIALGVSLAYISFPVQFTLGMGQVNLFALLLIVLAVVREAAMPVVSGVLFAAAILLKPELLLVFPIMLFARRWKTAAAATGMLALSVAVSVAAYGLPAYAAYASRMSTLASGWRDTGIYYNQGLSGLIARLGGSLKAYLVVAAVCVGVTLVRMARTRVTYEDLVWRAMPLFILVEPIAWQHHMVFLLPTVIWAWARKPSPLVRSVLVAAYFLVSWNFAAPGFLDTMLGGPLIASHGTIGVLLLWLVTLYL